MDTILIPFSFSFARALGLIVFLPFEIFTVGLGVRFILSVLLGVSAVSQVQLNSDPNIVSYLVNFMAGFIIVFPVILLIQAADLWGDLFESLRGQTVGNIADPLFQGETSHIAIMSKSLIWIGLISVGLFEFLFAQFLKSFNLSVLDISLWQKSILLFAEVLSAAMKLAVPFAVLFLVVELLGIFSAKLLPGVSLITEIFTVKMFLGFLGFLSILGLEPLSSLKIILFKLDLL